MSSLGLLPDSLQLSLIALLFEDAVVDAMQELLLVDVSAIHHLTPLLPILLCILHLLLDSLRVFELIPVVRRLVNSADRLLCLQGLHQRVEGSRTVGLVFQSTK